MRRVSPESSYFCLDVLRRAHGCKLFCVVGVVVVDRSAKTFVGVRKGGIWGQDVEHGARQDVARARCARVKGSRRAQAAGRGWGLLRLRRVPAPAQVWIVAWPEAVISTPTLAQLSHLETVLPVGSQMHLSHL